MIVILAVRYLAIKGFLKLVFQDVMVFAILPIRFYGSFWDAFASAVFLVAGGIIAFSLLLIQTVFILMRWPGWAAAQIVGLLILFLLGFPAVRATAQMVLHRK